MFVGGYVCHDMAVLHDNKVPNLADSTVAEGMAEGST